MRIDVHLLVGDHCRSPAGTDKLKPTYLRCVGWKNRLVTFVLWELGADLQPLVPGHSRAQLRHARCIAQQCTLSTVFNYKKLDMSVYCLSATYSICIFYKICRKFHLTPVNAKLTHKTDSNLKRERNKKNPHLHVTSLGN